MIQVSIDKPEIEEFFQSDDEIVEALEYIVYNNIDYKSEITKQQREELLRREKYYLENPNAGISWEEIKAKYI